MTRTLDLRKLGAFFLPVHLVDGECFVFDVTTCEECGGDVLAAPPVRVYASPATCERAGLRGVGAWPSYPVTDETTLARMCEACAPRQDAPHINPWRTP